MNIQKIEYYNREVYVDFDSIESFFNDPQGGCTIYMKSGGKVETSRSAEDILKILSGNTSGTGPAPAAGARAPAQGKNQTL